MTDSIKKIYLYVKTHNKTGLKYFGKTERNDPYSYLGSGKHWRRHLRKYGNDIHTEILNVYTDKEKCRVDAINFSIQNNIVESKEWANLVVEMLDGGDTSKTENYINSVPKIKNHHKKSKWWNNGTSQVFCENPPDETYTRGRLSYNNIGAKKGSNIQRGKIWVNNGIQEFMVEKNNIPEGFSKGRLKSKCFNGGKTRGDVKGTIWWNNGQVEKMSKNKPDDSFVKGRLKKS